MATDNKLIYTSGKFFKYVIRILHELKIIPNDPINNKSITDILKIEDDISTMVLKEFSDDLLKKLVFIMNTHSESLKKSFELLLQLLEGIHSDNFLCCIDKKDIDRLIDKDTQLTSTLSDEGDDLEIKVYFAILQIKTILNNNSKIKELKELRRELNDAQSQYDQAVAEAKAIQAQLDDVQAQHNQVLADAQTDHDHLMANAHTQHEQLMANAQSQHNTLAAEAQTQTAERIKKLEDEKRAILSKLQDLAKSEHNKLLKTNTDAQSEESNDETLRRRDRGNIQRTYTESSIGVSDVHSVASTLQSTASGASDPGAARAASASTPARAAPVPVPAPGAASAPGAAPATDPEPDAAPRELKPPKDSYKGNPFRGTDFGKRFSLKTDKQSGGSINHATLNNIPYINSLVKYGGVSPEITIQNSITNLYDILKDYLYVFKENFFHNLLYIYSFISKIKSNLKLTDFISKKSEYLGGVTKLLDNILDCESQDPYDPSINYSIDQDLLHVLFIKLGNISEEDPPSNYLSFIATHYSKIVERDSLIYHSIDSYQLSYKYIYIGNFIRILGESRFPPINNEELATILSSLCDFFDLFGGELYKKLEPVFNLCKPKETETEKLENFNKTLSERKASVPAIRCFQDDDIKIRNICHEMIKSENRVTTILKEETFGGEIEGVRSTKKFQLKHDGENYLLIKYNKPVSSPNSFDVYSCGYIDDIYLNNDSSGNINERIIINTTNKIFENAKSKKVSVLQVFGASGTGKSSLLFGYNQSSGIINECCKKLGDKKGYNNMTVSCYECMFESKDSKDSKDINNFIKEKQGTLSLTYNNDTWKTTDTENKELNSLLLDCLKSATKKPTPYNDKSSRGLLFIIIILTNSKGDIINILICDLPGMEKSFTCESPDILEKFLQKFLKIESESSSDQNIKEYFNSVNEEILKEEVKQEEKEKETLNFVLQNPKIKELYDVQTGGATVGIPSDQTILKDLLTQIGDNDFRKLIESFFRPINDDKPTGNINLFSVKPSTTDHDIIEKIQNLHDEIYAFFRKVTENLKNTSYVHKIKYYLFIIKKFLYIYIYVYISFHEYKNLTEMLNEPNSLLYKLFFNFIFENVYDIFRVALVDNKTLLNPKNFKEKVSDGEFNKIKTTLETLIKDLFKKLKILSKYKLDKFKSYCAQVNSEGVFNNSLIYDIIDYIKTLRKNEFFLSIGGNSYKPIVSTPKLFYQDCSDIVKNENSQPIKNEEIKVLDTKQDIKPIIAKMASFFNTDGKPVNVNVNDLQFMCIFVLNTSVNVTQDPEIPFVYCDDYDSLKNETNKELVKPFFTEALNFSYYSTDDSTKKIREGINQPNFPNSEQQNIAYKFIDDIKLNNCNSIFGFLYILFSCNYSKVLSKLGPTTNAHAEIKKNIDSFDSLTDADDTQLITIDIKELFKGMYMSDFNSRTTFILSKLIQFYEKAFGKKFITKPVDGDLVNKIKKFLKIRGIIPDEKKLVEALHNKLVIDIGGEDKTTLNEELKQKIKNFLESILKIEVSQPSTTKRTPFRGGHQSFIGRSGYQNIDEYKYLKYKQKYLNLLNKEI